MHVVPSCVASSVVKYEKSSSCRGGSKSSLALLIVCLSQKLASDFLHCEEVGQGAARKRKAGRPALRSSVPPLHNQLIARELSKRASAQLRPSITTVNSSGVSRS